MNKIIIKTEGLDKTLESIEDLTALMKEVKAESTDIKPYIKFSKEVEKVENKITEIIKDNNEERSDIVEKNIDIQEKELKSLDKAYSDSTSNIGDSLGELTSGLGALASQSEAGSELLEKYSKAIEFLGVAKNISGSIKLLNADIKETSKDGNKASGFLTSFAEGFKGLIGGIKASVGSLKLFRLALISTGVGAIVVLVGVLLEKLGGLTSVVNFVTDAFKGLGNVFQSIPELASKAFNALPNLVTSAFNTVIQIVKDFGNVIESVFTFDPQKIKEALAQSAKTFIDAGKGVINVAKKIGSEIGDKFIDGFEVSAGLRENELKKKQIELLNAQREARRKVLASQLDDDRKTLEERERLLKEDNNLERAALTDQLNIAKERVALLSRLGNNLSKEQKDELAQLKTEIVSLNADINDSINKGLNIQRELFKQSQELKLKRLKEDSAKEIELLERDLAKKAELQQLSAAEELAVNERINALKLNLIDSEIKALEERKARFERLNQEELDRERELLKAKEDLIFENETKIKEITLRRIGETSLFQTKALEKQAAQLDILERSNERFALKAQLAAEKENEQLEAQLEKVISLKDIESFKLNSQKAATEQSQRQLELLSKKLEVDLKRNQIEKENLKLQIERIEALDKLGLANKEQLADLETFKAQLEGLDEAELIIKAQFELDKNAIDKELKDNLKEIGKKAADSIESFLADPIGNTFTNILSKNLNLTAEKAAKVTEILKGVGEQLIETLSQGFEFFLSTLDENIKKAKEEVELSKENISILDQQINDSVDKQAELYDKLKEASTGQQSAIIAQLNVESQKRAELEAQKQKAIDEEIKAQKALEKAEKDKAKAEKAKAIIDLAVNSALSFSKAAIAIAAAAANTPFPANLVAIATTAAAVLGTIGGVLSLAKFEKGGVLEGPSHANGGILAVNKGKPIAEVEGGEVILTKGVSKNPQLLKAASDINVLGGGVPLFATGGVLETSGSISETIEPSIKGISDLNQNITQLAERPVYVAVTDIKKGISVVDSINQNSSF
jgi:hypothetical protein